MDFRMNSKYKEWLIELKSKIRSTQIKAAKSVNSTLIEFYYDLGKMIIEKETAWGSHFLENLSKDLKKEFPEMKGFSVTNLKYCRLFFGYLQISPQVGDELEKLKSSLPTIEEIEADLFKAKDEGSNE